ncbi:MAG: hypothetical protein WA865_06120 [Spirulinaceae cyanobacterium]
MITLTIKEISQYRNQLAIYSEALVALDMLEDCEGSLEDAALALAIQAGQQPDRINWLDGIAKRYRTVICQAEFREDLTNNNVSLMVKHLIEQKVCPAVLAAIVVIYIVEQGVEDFCQPLELKL